MRRRPCPRGWRRVDLGTSNGDPQFEGPDGARAVVHHLGVLNPSTRLSTWRVTFAGTPRRELDDAAEVLGRDPAEALRAILSLRHLTKLLPPNPPDESP